MLQCMTSIVFLIVLSLLHVQSFNLYQFSFIKKYNKQIIQMKMTKIDTTSTATDKIANMYGKVRNFDANIMISDYEESLFNSSLVARASELFGADESNLDEIFRTPELRKRLIRSYSDDTAGISATFLGVFLGYFWAHGGLLTMTLCGLAGNSFSRRPDAIGTFGRITGGVMQAIFRDLPRGNIPLLKTIFDKDENSEKSIDGNSLKVPLEKIKSYVQNLISSRTSSDSR